MLMVESLRHIWEDNVYILFYVLVIELYIYCVKMQFDVMTLIRLPAIFQALVSA